MNMEELQEQLAAAEARATELEDKLEFYTYRNNCRWERLWHFAHEELPEDLRNRYFHIVANGTADTSEHPRIAQEYNMLKHRAGQAEARAQSAEVQLATLRPKLADCEEALSKAEAERESAYAEGRQAGAENSAAELEEA